jgi:hypothetical protein
MTREEFDLKDSLSNHPLFGNNIACPDCGSFATHPTVNCDCYKITGGNGKHIMKYHHTCKKEV